MKMDVGDECDETLQVVLSIFDSVLSTVFQEIETVNKTVEDCEIQLGHVDAEQMDEELQCAQDVIDEKDPLDLGDLEQHGDDYEPVHEHLEADHLSKDDDLHQESKQSDVEDEVEISQALKEVDKDKDCEEDVGIAVPLDKELENSKKRDRNEKEQVKENETITSNLEDMMKGTDEAIEKDKSKDASESGFNVNEALADQISPVNSETEKSENPKKSTICLTTVEDSGSNSDSDSDSNSDSDPDGTEGADASFERNDSNLPETSIGNESQCKMPPKQSVLEDSSKNEATKDNANMEKDAKEEAALPGSSKVSNDEMPVPVKTADKEKAKQNSNEGSGTSSGPVSKSTCDISVIGVVGPLNTADKSQHDEAGKQSDKDKPRRRISNADDVEIQPIIIPSDGPNKSPKGGGSTQSSIIDVEDENDDDVQIVVTRTARETRQLVEEKKKKGVLVKAMKENVLLRISLYRNVSIGLLRRRFSEDYTEKLEVLLQLTINNDFDEYEKFIYSLPYDNTVFLIIRELRRFLVMLRQYYTDFPNEKLYSSFLPTLKYDAAKVFEDSEFDTSLLMRRSLQDKYLPGILSLKDEDPKVEPPDLKWEDFLKSKSGSGDAILPDLVGGEAEVGETVSSIAAEEAGNVTGARGRSSARGKQSSRGRQTGRGKQSTATAAKTGGGKKQHAPKIGGLKISSIARDPAKDFEKNAPAISSVDPAVPGPSSVPQICEVESLSVGQMISAISGRDANATYNISQAAPKEGAPSGQQNSIRRDIETPEVSFPWTAVESKYQYLLLGNTSTFRIYCSMSSKTLIKCKIFLPSEIHETLPSDPWFWQYAKVHFFPSLSMPKLLTFFIGNGQKIQCHLPSSAKDIENYVRERSCFALSDERMMFINNQLIKDYKRTLCEEYIDPRGCKCATNTGQLGSEWCYKEMRFSDPRLGQITEKMTYLTSLLLSKETRISTFYRACYKLMAIEADSCTVVEPAHVFSIVSPNWCKILEQLQDISSKSQGELDNLTDVLRSLVKCVRNVVACSSTTPVVQQHPAAYTPLSSSVTSQNLQSGAKTGIAYTSSYHGHTSMPTEQRMSHGVMPSIVSVVGSVANSAVGGAYQAPEPGSSSAVLSSCGGPGYSQPPARISVMDVSPVAHSAGPPQAYMSLAESRHQPIDLSSDPLSAGNTTSSRETVIRLKDKSRPVYVAFQQAGNPGQEASPSFAIQNVASAQNPPRQEEITTPSIILSSVRSEAPGEGSKKNTKKSQILLIKVDKRMMKETTTKMSTSEEAAAQMISSTAGTSQQQVDASQQNSNVIQSVKDFDFEVHTTQRTPSVNCEFPECVSIGCNIQVKELPYHLYTKHFYLNVLAGLKAMPNFDKKMNTCIISDCTFPVFLKPEMLAQHFAIGHRRVNNLYRTRCKAENWQLGTFLKNTDFFVESTEPKCHINRTCPHCLCMVMEDYFNLHEDYCARAGLVSKQLCKELNLHISDSNVDIRKFTRASSHICPKDGCTYAANFNSLLKHYEETHYRSEKADVFRCPKCLAPQYADDVSRFSVHFCEHLLNWRDTDKSKSLDRKNNTFNLIMEIELTFGDYFNKGRGFCKCAFCGAQLSNNLFGHLCEKHPEIACFLYLYFNNNFEILNMFKHHPKEYIQLAKIMMQNRFLKQTPLNATPREVLQIEMLNKVGSLAKSTNKVELVELIEIPDSPRASQPSTSSGGSTQQPDKASGDEEESQDMSCARSIAISDTSGSTVSVDSLQVLGETCSSGIEFVPPRSTSLSDSDGFFPYVKVILNEDLNLLYNKRIMTTKMLKQFLLYLISRQTHSSISPTFTTMNMKTSYVTIWDKILYVEKIESLKIFQEFVVAYPLLVEFDKYCKRINKDMITCEPWEIVLMLRLPSKFSNEEQAKFLNMLSFLQKADLEDPDSVVELIQQEVIVSYANKHNLKFTQLFSHGEGFRRYLTCVDCFPPNFYFSSVTEALEHVHHIHSRQKPARMICGKCNSSIFNVTPDPGSKALFGTHFNKHKMTIGHFMSTHSKTRPITDIRDKDNCCVCSVKVDSAHITLPSHNLRMKVLEFFEEICSHFRFSPVDLLPRQTYKFALLLMIAHPRMRSVRVETFDDVLRCVLPHTYTPLIQDKKTTVLPFSQLFCFACKVPISHAESLPIHLQHCKPHDPSTQLLNWQTPFFFIETNKFYSKKEIEQVTKSSIFLGKSSIGSFDCLACEYFYFVDESTAEDHIKTCHNEQIAIFLFRCMRCQDMITCDADMGATLRDHIAEHNLSDQAQHCAALEKETQAWTKNKDCQVMIHWREKRRADRVYMRYLRDDIFPVESSSSEEVNKYKCQHCSVELDSAGQLTAHYITCLQSKQKVKSEICSPEKTRTKDLQVSESQQSCASPLPSSQIPASTLVHYLSPNIKSESPSVTSPLASASASSSASSTLSSKPSQGRKNILSIPKDTSVVLVPDHGISRDTEKLSGTPDKLSDMGTPSLSTARKCSESQLTSRIPTSEKIEDSILNQGSKRKLDECEVSGPSTEVTTLSVSSSSRESSPSPARKKLRSSTKSSPELQSTSSSSGSKSQVPTKPVKTKSPVVSLPKLPIGPVEDHSAASRSSATASLNSTPRLPLETASRSSASSASLASSRSSATASLNNTPRLPLETASRSSASSASLASGSGGVPSPAASFTKVSRSSSKCGSSVSSRQTSRSSSPAISIDLSDYEFEDSETRSVESPRQVDLDMLYLCTECEVQRFDCTPACNHLNHPRVIIGSDIADHLDQTGHVSFEPVDQHLPLVDTDSNVLRCKNVSFSRKYGKIVRRKYKLLIMEGVIKNIEYRQPRPCMRCKQQFKDPFQLFLHIQKHIEKHGNNH